MSLEGLINLRKTYQNNPLTAYLNIDTLSEKIISLKEILKKAKIDVLCIDETKLDFSFSVLQFKILGEIKITREEKKWFLFERVLIQSKRKTLKRKTLKLYVLNLSLLRKSDALFLFTVPKTLIKKNFFMKF